MSTIYSLEEVKKHNDSESIWLVIHNSVYDVTDYREEHPGGEDVLLENAGKEASVAFDKAGHSSDAIELMAKFKIGELIDADRKLVKSQTEGSAIPLLSSLKWIVPITLGVIGVVLCRRHFRA